MRVCRLVGQGIEAWIEAGKLLCEIVEDEPQAMLTIARKHPYLTPDVLETFLRIGRKQLHPYLVIDTSPGAQKLASLPYESQVEMYDAPVTLVVRTKDGIHERRKRISELSSKEVATVFDGQRVRTTAEQATFLRTRGVIVRATRSPQEPAIEREGALTSTPVEDLRRHLQDAHDSLLEARTSLAMQERDSGLDAHITQALRVIGELRFAVNERWSA